MIIECVNCSKKFSVNSDLIPFEGRTIQCGSCNHTWFFKKEDDYKVNVEKAIISGEIDEKNQIPENTSPKKIKKQILIKEKRGTEIVEYTPKTTFTFGKFLSYIIVIIVSFIAVVLLLDTFKVPLYKFFPNLEFILFSLYETLKDIQLFIMDLI